MGWRCGARHDPLGLNRRMRLTDIILALAAGTDLPPFRLARWRIFCSSAAQAAPGDARGRGIQRGTGRPARVG